MLDLLLLVLGVGLVLAAGTVGRIRRVEPTYWERAMRAAGAIGLLLPGTFALLFAGLHFWSEHRVQPEPLQKTLLPGVEYQRMVRRVPRTVVAHLVTVDLSTGVRLLVTPGDAVEGGEVRARTTRQFAREFGVQVAINGAAWEPWWSNSPWDYYPHAGDPVDVLGLAVSEGMQYSPPSEKHPAVCFSRDNRVWFDEKRGEAYNACSGKSPLLKDGKPVPWPIRVDAGDEPHPRSVVAVDRSGKKLILMVIDGRQPGYSEGATRAELAELVLEYGGYHALNLDGGGSSTLVVEGPDGRPQVLNSPIDCHIPGRERPSANHLGLFVPH